MKILSTIRRKKKFMISPESNECEAVHMEGEDVCNKSPFEQSGLDQCGMFGYR